MTADILLGHIKEIGKEKEKNLREEHEREVARIEKERLDGFEELKTLLEREVEAERVSMIERLMREEESKIKAEISFRKNELLKQTKREAKKMFFKMDKEKIINIFAARLKSIKNRLLDEAKLISSEEYLSLAKEISKKAEIRCPIEVGGIADGKLVLESRRMMVELSVEELIEDSAEKNSAKLYQIIFD